MAAGYPDLTLGVLDDARAPQRGRRRVIATVAIVAAAVGLALAVGGPNTQPPRPAHEASSIAAVNATLAGIPQHANVLGNPGAPVTITEYCDLVGPLCAEFANTSEPQIIATLVRPGKAKIVYRGLETGSAAANNSGYVTSQVAARSAGLQDKEWNYVLLTYKEQPQTINGRSAVMAPYISPAYLANIARQITGLNLVRWRADLPDRYLVQDVYADRRAAFRARIIATPTVFISGPKGTRAHSGIPMTAAEVEHLVTQVR